MAAVVALNLGLALRVTSEPVERADNAHDLTTAASVLSGLAQVTALAIFVVQIWPRVGPNAVRRPAQRLADE
jgi:hypothetical protein